MYPVFPVYSASLTSIVTCVTHTDLTDWLLVKNSVEIMQFWTWKRQKYFHSKILFNVFFYSDDFPFIKAFFGNQTYNNLIVYCIVRSKPDKYANKKQRSWLCLN